MGKEEGHCCSRSNGMGANVLGLVSENVVSTANIARGAQHDDNFVGGNGDGLLCVEVVPSVDWSVFGCVVDCRNSSVHFPPKLNGAEDWVIGLDLGTCFHFLAALLIDICDGNIMC